MHSAEKGAGWAAPLVKLDRAWNFVEARLLVVVLMAQLAALLAWVVLGGLAAPPESSSAVAFRSAIGAVVLGGLGWRALAALPSPRRQQLTVLAALLGLALGPAWRGMGNAYFDNLRAWLQEGSLLTLMGGLRGVATRLTLLLALLGASLATGVGKHIHIDVVFRFLPKALQKISAAVTAFVAGLVCLFAVWGFFDYIAIAQYGSQADAPASSKISTTAHHLERSTFLAWKQVGLDLQSLPKVLSGERYDRWMPAGEWNAWVKDAGFESHYEASTVSSLLVADDSPPHSPLVIAPDGVTTRGLLAHDLNLIFPFGLLMIGLRFLLRGLLFLTGHIDADPDAAHRSLESAAGEAS